MEIFGELLFTNDHFLEKPLQQKNVYRYSFGSPWTIYKNFLAQSK